MRFVPFRTVWPRYLTIKNMNKSEFWACLKCGVFLRGSHYEILEQSKNHQALCAENSTERENIQKIIKGLQEFSSILPPPPPPPISKDFFERKISTMKKRANISDKSVVQNENIAANDPRLKMPVSVVDGLKKFFKLVWNGFDFFFILVCTDVSTLLFSVLSI